MNSATPENIPEAIPEAVPEAVPEESTTKRSSKSYNYMIDAIKFIIKQMYILIISIIVGIILFFYLKNKGFKTRVKVLISLIPLVLSIIYYYIKLSPKPISKYIFSKKDGENISFEHVKKGNNWMFSGSATIDINGKPHLFIGGGQDQDDVLLKYENNKFVNVIKKLKISSKSPTFSAVSFDMTGNGLDDLIVGRENGITVYVQTKKNKFKPQKIFKFAGSDKTPLALSVADFNKDGKPDIYVTFFTHLSKFRGAIFNDPSHDRENVLLKNISDDKSSKLEFKDVTKETNAGGRNNTFTSAFVDLNNNGYPDIVLANDSGFVQVLQNNKGVFTSQNVSDGMGNWMGLGIGDINNNGFQDLFLTNIGTDLMGAGLSTGDIKPEQKQAFSHILLQNEGNYKFKDVTKEKGISGKRFGWGAVIEDLNLDGREDILFGENFLADPQNIIFPGVGYHYEQKQDGTFERKFKYNNPHFAQTPILIDLTGNGVKDIVWINVKGQNVVHFRKTTNNFINVKLPKNVKFANATVVLDGKYHKQNIHGGVGFGSGQSNVLTFGLNKRNKVKGITVTTLYGEKYTVNNPTINKTLVLEDFTVIK